MGISLALASSQVVVNDLAEIEGEVGDDVRAGHDLEAPADLNRCRAIFNPTSSCRNRKSERLPDYRDVVILRDVGGCVRHHRNRPANVLPWYDAKTRNPLKLLRSSWHDR